jgi:dihydroflavonol-4-reductase
MQDELVLVTGGTGFLGVHCIDQLLRAGYRVRTTVRTLKRQSDVLSMLQNAGTPRLETLRFTVATLDDDSGWPDAVAGCQYVLHVASPVPASAPKSEEEVIKPAHDGTLRVLRAARDAGVRRVVLTSSVVSIIDGHDTQVAPFNESSWTDVTQKGVTAYSKSKTLAERAAWDFIDQEGNGLELSVINPVAIFGPVFGPDFSSSVEIIKRMMDGFPFCPQLYFTVVDVRDVADLHLRAMTDPHAKGQRFLAGAPGLLSLLDIARILGKRLPEAARKVPTRELPDWLVRMISLFVPDLKLVVNDLGKKKSSTSEKAMKELGWQPRSSEVAIVDAAESLLKLGIVKQ